MFEILSFLFGGMFRLAPEIMKYLDKANERKHELGMIEAQLKADVTRAEVQGKIQMTVAELQVLMEVNRAQMTPIVKTGNLWIDGFNAFWDGVSKSVRPVLTYWYCVVAYGFYKGVIFYNAATILESKSEAILHIWTPQDQQVMWSIIGFWFVDRALRKMGGNA